MLEDTENNHSEDSKFSVPSSLSEEDEEIADTLDVKPPQPPMSQSNDHRKYRDASKKSHRKHSERYKDEKISYGHHGKEKQNHRKHCRVEKESASYRPEKGRYYTEQMRYEENDMDIQDIGKQLYMKHNEDISRSYRHSVSSEKERKERHDGKAHYLKKHITHIRSVFAENKSVKELEEQQFNKYDNKNDDGYDFKRSGETRKTKRYKETVTVDCDLQDKTGAGVQNTKNWVEGDEHAKVEDKTKRKRTKERRLLHQKHHSHKDINLSSRKRSKHKQYEEVEEEADDINKRLHCHTDIITLSDSSDYDVDSNVKEYLEHFQSNHNIVESSSDYLNDDNSSPKDVTFMSEEKSDTAVVNLDHLQFQENLNSSQDNNQEEEQEELNEMESVESLPPYYPAIQGCRSVNEFQLLNHVDEGTYGVVYRARDKQFNEIVALKRLKMEREKEGFPITSLREINTMLKSQHPNVVTVREIVVGNNMDKIYIVMDFVEHDLKSLMENMRLTKQIFTTGEVKCLLKQLLSAVAFLHDNWILHRDLKTSNLLLSSKGILKVGDFGLAREYGSPLKAYTPLVVTLWYRAPELLLCTKVYTTPIDMWSVGCIFGELVLMNPVFSGKSEVEQLSKIFRVLGTPNENMWPGFNKLPAVQKLKFVQYPMSNLRTRFNTLSVQGLTLLRRFLTYDPAQRITAEDALQHSYFTETPLPTDPSMFSIKSAKTDVGKPQAAGSTLEQDEEYKKLLEALKDRNKLAHRKDGGISTTESGSQPVQSEFRLKF